MSVPFVTTQSISISHLSVCACQGYGTHPRAEQCTGMLRRTDYRRMAYRVSLVASRQLTKSGLCNGAYLAS